MANATWNNKEDTRDNWSLDCNIYWRFLNGVSCSKSSSLLSGSTIILNSLETHQLAYNTTDLYHQQQSNSYKQSRQWWKLLAVYKPCITDSASTPMTRRQALCSCYTHTTILASFTAAAIDQLFTTCPAVALYSLCDKVTTELKHHHIIFVYAFQVHQVYAAQSTTAAIQLDWAVDTMDLRVKDVIVCASVDQFWTCSHDCIHRIGIHWWLQWFQDFYACASPVGRELFWLHRLELLSCTLITLKFSLLHETQILWVMPP